MLGRSHIRSLPHAPKIFYSRSVECGVHNIFLECAIFVEIEKIKCHSQCTLPILIILHCYSFHGCSAIRSICRSSSFFSSSSLFRSRSLNSSSVKTRFDGNIPTASLLNFHLSTTQDHPIHKSLQNLPPRMLALLRLQLQNFLCQ